MDITNGIKDLKEMERLLDVAIDSVRKLHKIQKIINSVPKTDSFVSWEINRAHAYSMIVDVTRGEDSHIFDSNDKFLKNEWGDDGKDNV